MLAHYAYCLGGSRHRSRALLRHLARPKSVAAFPDPVQCAKSPDDRHRPQTLPKLYSQKGLGCGVCVGVGEGEGDRPAPGSTTQCERHSYAPSVCTCTRRASFLIDLPYSPAI